MSNLKPFSLVPTTLTEAVQYARLISNSTFVPTQFRGKPEDILVAIQWGAELGLPPLQSLQNIAVINGRPTLWGDAALAVVQQHHDYEWIKEFIEEDDKGNVTAVCLIKRANHEPHRSEFSVDMAKKAGLLGRQGPWSQYPKRMLQMRARGFGLRDVFADALRGLITREEAMDYKIVDAVIPETVTPFHLTKEAAESILEQIENTKPQEETIKEKVAS
ncbi:hypothetical protein [Candidatus Odyssella acanthamoebae]|uniref:hypothetical protein n=1 Tax=Candidatus Odyssella acanthamoebae TaxID=91604 RepID=UPI000691D725|nr:hypothetical protein [Candidatus Paracaedibacter acanthamoebae]